MALDLAALTQTAMAAATTAGVTATATITRPAPAPDPLTGVASGSAVTQTVRVAPAKPQRTASARGDGAWSAASTTLFLAANDATFTPVRGDLVAFGGVTYRLVVLEAYQPTGVPIGWMLGLGDEVRRG